MGKKKTKVKWNTIESLPWTSGPEKKNSYITKTVNHYSSDNKHTYLPPRFEKRNAVMKMLGKNVESKAVEPEAHPEDNLFYYDGQFCETEELPNGFIKIHSKNLDVIFKRDFYTEKVDRIKAGNNLGGREIPLAIPISEEKTNTTEVLDQAPLPESETSQEALNEEACPPEQSMEESQIEENKDLDETERNLNDSGFGSNSKPKVQENSAPLEAAKLRKEKNDEEPFYFKAKSGDENGCIKSEKVGEAQPFSPIPGGKYVTTKTVGEININQFVVPSDDVSGKHFMATGDTTGAPLVDQETLGENVTDPHFPKDIHEQTSVPISSAAAPTVPTDTGLFLFIPSTNSLISCTQVIVPPVNPYNLQCTCLPHTCNRPTSLFLTDPSSRPIGIPSGAFKRVGPHPFVPPVPGFVPSGPLSYTNRPPVFNTNLYQPNYGHVDEDYLIERATGFPANVVHGQTNDGMYHLFPEDGRPFSAIFDNKQCGEFPGDEDTKESGLHNANEMTDEPMAKEPVVSSNLGIDIPGFIQGGQAGFGIQNNDNHRRIIEMTEDSKRRQDKRGKPIILESHIPGLPAECLVVKKTKKRKKRRKSTLSEVVTNSQSSMDEEKLVSKKNKNILEAAIVNQAPGSIGKAQVNPDNNSFDAIVSSGYEEAIEPTTIELKLSQELASNLVDPLMYVLDDAKEDSCEKVIEGYEKHSAVPSKLSSEVEEIISSIVNDIIGCVTDIVAIDPDELPDLVDRLTQNDQQCVKHNSCVQFTATSIEEYVEDRQPVNINLTGSISNVIYQERGVKQKPTELQLETTDHCDATTGKRPGQFIKSANTQEFQSGTTSVNQVKLGSEGFLENASSVNKNKKGKKKSKAEYKQSKLLSNANLSKCGTSERRDKKISCIENESLIEEEVIIKTSKEQQSTATSELVDKPAADVGNCSGLPKDKNIDNYMEVEREETIKGAGKKEGGKKYKRGGSKVVQTKTHRILINDDDVELRWRREVKIIEEIFNSRDFKEASNVCGKIVVTGLGSDINKGPMESGRLPKASYSLRSADIKGEETTGEGGEQINTIRDRKSKDAKKNDASERSLEKCIDKKQENNHQIDLD